MDESKQSVWEKLLWLSLQNLFLPSSPAAFTRATVVAVKYSIVERPEKIDSVLHPEISTFLMLIKDQDRHVRRAAVAIKSSLFKIQVMEAIEVDFQKGDGDRHIYGDGDEGLRLREMEVTIC
ncbi:hypothetical protein L1987_40709 [Smallanthus sonchifolius]|uniref:Uncharacterized protein n=1 Tax=Smallanthus sonchifolius TaxID=185202 RepID=A0ACB9GTR2_9ASTR|nr:hypothetical protein L1987_40709 [Smallanthus sonchifolius]